MKSLTETELAELANLPLDRVAGVICYSIGSSLAELSARHGLKHLPRGHGDCLSKLRGRAWWMMRQVKRYGQPVSYPEIAALFGTRHTTVLEGVKRYERERAGTGEGQ